ncbi:hypothetical protein MIR68_000492 [Amoeboaphelidium protococcarum]|nr:hypothetical protein MIR68_000492 [Amoeboaphelidium protococcarum]
MLPKELFKFGTIPRIRSLFNVPGSNENMLQKCMNRGADAVVLDLEDGVAFSAKRSARKMIVDFLQQHTRKEDERQSQIFIRINALTSDGELSEQSKSDLSVLSPHLHLADGIVLPKTENSQHLGYLDKYLTQFGYDQKESQKRLSILSALESPMAILNAQSIAQSSSMVYDNIALLGLVFASEDYTASSRVQRTNDLSTYIYPRSHLQCVAKAYQLLAIDLVSISVSSKRDTKNEEWRKLLRSECLNGRKMGFNGKQCIHPGQIDVINKMFDPSEEEVSWAQKVMDVLKHKMTAQNLDTIPGAFELEGKAVDLPVIRDAIQTLSDAGWDMEQLSQKY